MGRDVNDLLEKAIYGNSETKPAERRLFLTTIFERVYIALTKKQVQTAPVYSEVEQTMIKANNLHLFLNGNLAYSDYAAYIKIAVSQNVPYTIVNPPTPTPFALVLADKSQPVQRADRFIKDDLYEIDMGAD